jgi:hypothetical protein
MRIASHFSRVAGSTGVMLTRIVLSLREWPGNHPRDATSQAEAAQGHVLACRRTAMRRYNLPDWPFGRHNEGEMLQSASQLAGATAPSGI